MHTFMSSDEEPGDDRMIAQIVTERETEDTKALLTKISVAAAIDLEVK